MQHDVMTEMQLLSYEEAFAIIIRTPSYSQSRKFSLTALKILRMTVHTSSALRKDIQTFMCGR